MVEHEFHLERVEVLRVETIISLEILLKPAFQTSNPVFQVQIEIMDLTAKQTLI